jgi:hypothetical protein
MFKITNNIRHLQACGQNLFVCIQKVFGNRFSLNTFNRKINWQLTISRIIGMPEIRQPLPIANCLLPVGGGWTKNKYSFR